MNVKQDPSPALVSFHGSPCHSEPWARQPPEAATLWCVPAISCPQRPILHLGCVKPFGMNHAPLEKQDLLPVDMSLLVF